MGVGALGWDPLLPVYPWAPVVCPSCPQNQVPVGEVLLTLGSRDMAPAHPDLGWPPLYLRVKSPITHERNDSFFMELRQKPWERQSLAV